MGGGLAGACAAAVLSRHFQVLVLEAAGPGSRASGASAGLVNPFSGLRAAPAWRFGEALEALRELSGPDGEVLRLPGLLRPARDAEQAEAFGERAASTHDELRWMRQDEIAERWPSVSAPFGGLWVRRGGVADVQALVSKLLAGVDLRTGVPVTALGERDDVVWAETGAGERLEGGRLILAVGDGFRHFPQTADLPLGRLKGQTVRVARPEQAGDLPILAGDGYLVPEPETLILGSTYERTFHDAAPTAQGAEAILTKTSRMVPALGDATVVEARAGVRVTVPARISSRRLPLVGPLPGHERVWCFLGLGSKGLLTAPLMARGLDDNASPRRDAPHGGGADTGRRNAT